MNKFLTIILTLLALLTAGLMGYFAVFKECHEQSDLKTTFIVNKPYRQVVLALAKPDTTEKMVEASGANMISIQWNDMDISIEKLLGPVWSLEGTAIIYVDHAGPYKNLYLELFQELQASQRQMRSRTSIKEPKFGVDFWSSMTVEPLGDKQTQIILEHHVFVKCRLSTHFHTQVRTEIEQTNAENIKNTENAIRKITESGLISIPINQGGLRGRERR